MKLKILKEAPKDLKAVLIAGPSNVGKSTFVKSVIPTEYQKYVLNPDKFYEPELAKIGGGSMNMKDFSPEQLSAAAKAQAVAVKQYRSELEKAIGTKPVILDITGGSFKKVKETKEKLEKQGYDVMMVLLYASPYTTLSRNLKRDRSLDPGIVIRNWEDVIKNAEQYEQLFGADNFALIDNDPEGANKSFDLADVEALFDKSKIWKEIPDEGKADIEQRIKSLIDRTEDAHFVAFDELATKLKGFLN
jgi:predicted kinase